MEKILAITIIHLEAIFIDMLGDIPNAWEISNGGDLAGGDGIQEIPNAWEISNGGDLAGGDHIEIDSIYLDHLSDALTKKDAKFQWNAQCQVSFDRAKLFLEGNLPHYQDSHCSPILTASNFLTASDFDYHCFKFYLINIIDRVCYLKRLNLVSKYAVHNTYKGLYWYNRPQFEVKSDSGSSQQVFGLMITAHSLDSFYSMDHLSRCCSSSAHHWMHSPKRMPSSNELLDANYHLIASNCS
ncbi:hypothetical protein B9Z55_026160 [Caenorhabditis nigoni]|uniref:Uncharacterized protein n=1 Tax=Caenorhabditis nigoni TaxID=1611254 RepID=A0A2G5T2C7_9PELO|nr:hypothetical protein B9Z55_026160 [Caenorhabditis nigoni]